jgi:uncharacterized membrane protein YdjX (TVP38/TMEM64 family)
MARKHQVALAVTFVLLIAGLLALVHFVPFQDLIEWIRHRGSEGVAVFFTVLVISNLLALPSTVLFVGAGLLYGTLWGTVLTTAGALVVEVAVLLLFRTHARAWFEQQAQHSDKLAAIDRAVSQSSFSVLWLLRLSPAVPFGLLNYAIAPLAIPLRRRLAANLLGMGPGNLVQAYIGSLLAGVGGLSNAAPGPWKWILLVAGVTTAVAAFAITTVATRRVLAHRSCDNSVRSGTTVGVVAAKQSTSS